MLAFFSHCALTVENGLPCVTVHSVSLTSENMIPGVVKSAFNVSCVSLQFIKPWICQMRQEGHTHTHTMHAHMFVPRKQGNFPFARELPRSGSLSLHGYVYDTAPDTHLGKLLDVTFVVRSISHCKSLEPICHISEDK